MPGYVIHLAVAKEYIRNFRVKNEEEFLKGTIAPDLLSVNGKSKTHYSKVGGSEVNLKQFLKENKISTSYMEGYFLHLIVDYLFYNKYFTNFDTRLYKEYDITNKELIEKYKIDIPEEIKDLVKFEKGNLEILNIEKIDKMISEISKKKISEYEKEVKKTGIVTTSTEENKLVTKSENKKEKIILAAIITILCLIMIFFINQKQGYHCDEIFSYGSSNSKYNNIFWSYNSDYGKTKLARDEIFIEKNTRKIAEKLKYYFFDHTDKRIEYEENENNENEEIRWRTSEEAEKYVKAKDNRFNYKSVYYNQIIDSHPPLFYILVHTVSSIFYNTFSKYMIFFINLPFFIGTCILIWKILNLLQQKTLSKLAVIFYGLSLGAISTMMFLRMYMMLTFFTISYLYIHLKIFKNEFKITKKTGILLFSNAILGYLTQYLFLIYAVTLSIIMIIIYIINKKYKELSKYLGILLISIIVGFFLFPFSISQLIISERTLNNIGSHDYIRKIIEYFKLALKYFGSDSEIAIALLAICLITLMLKQKKERALMSLIILPTILYTLIIARYIEFIELRYVMNVLPIVSIMIILAIGTIFENDKYNYIIAIITLIGLIGYQYKTEKPQYLYTEYKNCIEISKKYKDDDFVYVGYTFFNHMQNMPEFLNYNKTLMIYNDQIDKLIDDKELKDKNEFILSVNTTMNPEEVLGKVMENTKFTQYEVLYEDYENAEQKIYRIYK